MPIIIDLSHCTSASEIFGATEQLRDHLSAPQASDELDTKDYSFTVNGVDFIITQLWQGDNAGKWIWVTGNTDSDPFDSAIEAQGDAIRHTREMEEERANDQDTYYDELRDFRSGK